MTFSAFWSGVRQAIDAGEPFALATVDTGQPERRQDVAQRNVEIVIGRLVTDEGFRTAFFRNPAMTLIRFIESGYELTPLEVAALRATDAGVWTEAADQIDPRLQKVSFGCDDTLLHD